MIIYYQPNLLPFLKYNPNHLPAGISQHYYHSFEDGLWDLVKAKFSSRKKIQVLIPDFYCSDVLDNLKLHGISYTYYPLDRNFQIATSVFKKYLWLFQPDIIVIFHAAGITSNLIKDTGWLVDLPPQSLILEDSVHRLVDPETLRFINDRHFVMDSLRKVSPLTGSRMLASSLALDFSPARVKLSPYFLISCIYYLLFRVIFVSGCLIGSTGLVRWSHEYLLKKHDDLIGDSSTSHAGIPVLLSLIARFNYSKVRNMKKHQILLYKKLFNQVFTKKSVYEIPVSVEDSGQMHVYPLGLSVPPPIGLLDQLHSRKIPVWFKFTDTPWSQLRSVLFLPLGFHITHRDITYIRDTLMQLL